MLNVDKMIRTEVRVIKALYRKWHREVGQGTCLLPGMRHLDLKAYVTAVFEAHRSIIEQWNDWRFHGPTITVPESVPENAIAAMWSEARTWTINRIYEPERKDPGAKYIQHIDKTINSIVLEARYYAKTNQNTLEYVRRYPFDAAARLDNNALQMLMQKTVPEHWRERIGTDKSLFLLMSTQTGTWVAPIRVGQRFSSVILDMLSDEPEAWSVTKEYRSTPQHKSDIPALKMFFRRFFDRIGEGWSSQVTPIAATISVAPSSFLRLGEIGETNYKTGNSSCYGNGKAYEVAKNYLSLMPSTYVAFFYRDKIAERFRISKRGRRIGKIAGRCYGAIDPQVGMLATNFYLLAKSMAVPALQAAAQAMGMMWGNDKTEYTGAVHNFGGYAGHPNGDVAPIAARKGFAEIMGLSSAVYTGRLHPPVVSVDRWKDPCCNPSSQDRLLKFYKQYNETRTTYLRGLGYLDGSSKIVQMGPDFFSQKVDLANVDLERWRFEP